MLISPGKLQHQWLVECCAVLPALCAYAVMSVMRKLSTMLIPV
ncbi:hypothetical protein ACNKHR_07780 [Shigella flexneri]